MHLSGRIPILNDEQVAPVNTAGHVSPMKSLLVSLASLCLAGSLLAAPETLTATATLRADQPGAVVNPNVYGQFAEHLGTGIYGGVWVGPDSPIPNTRGFRNDVLEALKNLKVPVVRWPGGCFADEYHWKDGIGPRENRPKMINNNWGGVVENNHFGLHEFLDFCEIIGAEPYINGNIGSATVQEMVEWVEYMTSDADSPMANLRRANGREQPWKIKYFGFGNETWGCGGNMRPEYYADLYRQYDAFVKNYSGNKLFRIASGANGDDYHWTEVMMQMRAWTGPKAPLDGTTLHYYTIPTNNWSAKGSATDFAENQWFSTLRNTRRMDELIRKHSEIMDRYDPNKQIALLVDEWGIWTDPTPGSNPGFLQQQNTLRDALVAAINFHIFHQHAERVQMTNIAQMVNVLQAMILTDGPRMALTPTYWVFDMFKVHQGATVLPLELTSPDYKFGDEAIPAVTASATRAADGKATHVSFTNSDPKNPVTVSCSISGLTAKKVTGSVLTADAMNAHNTLDKADLVKPAAFKGAKLSGNTLSVTLPPKSVVVLELR